MDGFRSSKIYPKSDVPQGLVLSPLLFLFHENTLCTIELLTKFDFLDQIANKIHASLVVCKCSRFC